MIHSLKSEFRRLFTVRSTYILSTLALLIMGFFSFWLEGYKGVTGSPASTLQPTAIHEILINGVGLGITFASIIIILFMAHEYRYNTIMYTLTFSASRTRTLLAKMIAAASFCVGFGLLSTALAVGFYLLGVEIRDASLPAQQLDLWRDLGKLAFYCASYALVSLLIAMLARSLVAAIAIFLIAPTTVEPLLGMLLKEKAKYLPFTSLDSIMGNSISSTTLSSGTAMLVSAIYIAVATLVTWFLFVRRDAN